MKPETIRIIDVWAGRILCLALTFVRRLLDGLGGGRPAKGPVRKILFIKLIEQGATVLAYSAIRRAVAMVGRENVYFCVFEENSEIVHILDMVPRGNVLLVRHKQLTLFLWDIARLLVKVRRIGIDATVDMEFFARASAILAFLTGARRRVGLHRFTGEGPYRGDLLTHRVHYNPYLHTSKAYHLLVAALEMDPEDTPLIKMAAKELQEACPVFTPSEEERRRVTALLAEAFRRPPGVPLVLLNPNASDMLPLRKWETERFVTLGKRLLAADERLDIVITGAPSEAASAQDVALQIASERVVCLAGKTTLRELLVLYGLADALVTNDSGPGHFASMTGIFNIVLYGPETPALFGPIGGRGRTLYAGLACSPCVNVFNHRFSPCRNNRCMSAISVDEVFDAVQACLSDRSS